jgi:hypothetical protein
MLPYIMKIYQLVQKLIEGTTHRQYGDLITLFPFLERSLKIIFHVIFYEHYLLTFYGVCFISNIAYRVEQCSSNCGPQTTGGIRRFARRSAGDFRRRGIAKIISDTERMENRPVHVCAKTAFAG